MTYNYNNYRIGKTYEEMYGEKMAKKYKEKLSLALKGKKYTEAQKLKYKESHDKQKGIKYEERYGIERAKLIKEKIKQNTILALSKPEVSAKISAWQTGRKMPRSVVEKRAKTMKERAYKHSQETKDKIGKANSLSLLGKIQPQEVIDKRLKKLIGQKRTEKFKNECKERRAKQIFPIKDTTIEIKIQNFLKQLGYEFFTHKYIKEIEHKYQCDILIPALNLVIECDGNYWHNYPIGNDIDHIRTKELLEKGFKVLRLWEYEIRAMDINKFKGLLK